MTHRCSMLSLAMMLALTAGLTTLGRAQGGPPPGPPPARNGGPGGGAPPAGRGGRGNPGGPQGRGGGAGEAQLGPAGRWWDDAAYAAKLGLSSDQQKKMDDIFDANRVQLSERQAAVQVAEVELTPLLAPDQPDEAKVLAQIDRIAQARAELEKANAKMLLDIRKQLTHEQWVKLQAERPPAPPQPRPGGANPAAGGSPGDAVPHTSDGGFGVGSFLT